MSPEDAKRFRDRWSLVNQREHDELRQQPDSLKLRQTAALMQSVDALGWRSALGEEDELVWRRWQTLRRLQGTGS